jgi:hypothetical protein
MKNSIKDHWKESLKRCKANLKKTDDPVRREIIKEQIARYTHCIKHDIPQGDNSVYAQVQDDDTVHFSTGQGSNW